MDDKFFNKIMMINLFTIVIGLYNGSNRNNNKINNNKINNTKINNNKINNNTKN